MKHMGGTVSLEGRVAAHRGRPGDVQVPVPAGLDRAAVRDERPQPDAARRAADRRPPRRARCPLRDDAARARATALGRGSEDVLERYPIELSGGMKQRVVMVLSTLDPALLIADELTSALDVSTQKAVAELLVEFRDRGFVKSTIVITHDLSILYQMADTILVMYASQARREGAGRRDRREPCHPYTQLLLASLPSPASASRRSG